jgi:hypothetical protein
VIVQPVNTVVRGVPGVYNWTHSWSLGLGDIGAPVGFDFLRSEPRSIGVTGTDGVGANIVFQGSNDGATFTVLTTPIDSLLNSPLVSTLGYDPLPAYIQPYCNGGDVTTALVVTFTLSRSYR